MDEKPYIITHEQYHAILNECRIEDSSVYYTKYYDTDDFLLFKNDIILWRDTKNGKSDNFPVLHLKIEGVWCVVGSIKFAQKLINEHLDVDINIARTTDIMKVIATIKENIMEVSMIVRLTDGKTFHLLEDTSLEREFDIGRSMDLNEYQMIVSDEVRKYDIQNMEA